MFRYANIFTAISGATSYVFVGKKAIWQGLANRQSSFERILTDLNKERENENMNEMEIRQQERQRMKEVFDNAEAQGREQIANKMLVTTDLSSSQIIEILKDRCSENYKSCIFLKPRNI